MTFKPMTLAASTILALAITGPAVAAVDARQAVLVLPALRRQPPLRLVRRCAHRAGRVSGPKRRPPCVAGAERTASGPTRRPP